MQLSKDARRLYADFFEEVGLCEATRFPNVWIYSRKGARLLTAVLLVDGITIGRAIYVNPRFIRRSTSGRLIISKKLLAHEIVHVLQYSREGATGFLSNYIVNFWRQFRGRKRWTAKTWYEAYLSIPHEIEAREFAAKFKPWLTSRNSDY